MGYFLRRFISMVTNPFIRKAYIKCKCCDISYKICKKFHETSLNDAEAVIVLCESCWSGLTPKERIPFYKLLMMDWMDYDNDAWEDWPEIEKAILEGN